MTLAAIALVSCARPGAGSTTAQPADINAAGPTISDVRTLLGDSNWWQGPPSFGVRPLDASSLPDTVRFSLTQRFVHIGSAELFDVTYTVYDKVSTATTQMNTMFTRYSATSGNPKVGDQVLYLKTTNISGPAPFITHTFVRLGGVIVEIDWARKDGMPSVPQMGRNASKVVDGLKKATEGKAHPSPLTVDQKLLPPPGLDITFLGGTRLPVESWLMMNNAALPMPALQVLQGDGVNDFLFGDYALNRDPRMEVQAALLTFSTAAGAAAWAGTFSTGQPDPTTGVAGAYIDALGEYHYFLVSGVHGAMLVCKSATDGEAASRACESPMDRTALAWKISLGG